MNKILETALRDTSLNLSEGENLVTFLTENVASFSWRLMQQRVKIDRMNLH